MTRLVWALAALCVAPLALASGLETKRPTALFDAPSAQARARAILSGAHPLRQISEGMDGWRKIVTADGDSGWVAEADAQAARRAVVSLPRAAVRVDPHPQAPAAFYARRGVVLEILRRDGEWLQVLHEDGESGYVAAAAVWQNDR